MNMVKKFLSLSIILGLCYSPALAENNQKRSAPTSNSKIKIAKTVIIATIVVVLLWPYRKGIRNFIGQQISAKFFQKSPDITPGPSSAVEIPPKLTSVQAQLVQELIGQAQAILVNRTEHNIQEPVTEQENFILLQAATHIMRDIPRLPDEVQISEAMFYFLQQIKRLVPDLNKRLSMSRLSGIVAGWQSSSSQISNQNNQ
jgi:hypothetical protein